MNIACQRFLVTAALLALPVAASAATLYKWVDEQGNVHYTDTPPPQGVTSVQETSLTGPPDAADEIYAQQLADAIAQNPVTLFAISDCDSCDLVRLYLQRRDVEFAEKSVEQDPANQKELTDLAGRVEVPTLAVGKHLVRGYSRSSLDDAFRSAGFPEPPEADEAAAGEEPAGEQTDQPVMGDDGGSAQDGETVE